jgi:hypothetical protein
VGEHRALQSQDGLIPRRPAAQIISRMSDKG